MTHVSNSNGVKSTANEVRKLRDGRKNWAPIWRKCISPMGACSARSEHFQEDFQGI